MVALIMLAVPAVSLVIQVAVKWTREKGIGLSLWDIRTG